MSDAKKFDPVRLNIALDAVEEMGFYDEAQLLRELVRREVNTRAQIEAMRIRVARRLHEEIATTPDLMWSILGSRPRAVPPIAPRPFLLDSLDGTASLLREMLVFPPETTGGEGAKGG